jgi:hypothetical protein
MDKNKFWLGGRLFNTASRRVRKLGGPTHVRNANARHVRNAIANARQGTSANANARHARNANARHVHNAKASPHVRKMAAPTKPKAHPQHGRPNAKLIRNENVDTREH